MVTISDSGAGPKRSAPACYQICLVLDHVTICCTTVGGGYGGEGGG